AQGTLWVSWRPDLFRSQRLPHHHADVARSAANGASSPRPFLPPPRTSHHPCLRDVLVVACDPRRLRNGALRRASMVGGSDVHGQFSAAPGAVGDEPPLVSLCRGTFLPDMALVHGTANAAMVRSCDTRVPGPVVPGSLDPLGGFGSLDRPSDLHSHRRHRR